MRTCPKITLEQFSVWLLAAAIPMFFVAIALEMWVAHRQKRDVYVFADSITSLSCGALQQVGSVWLKALGLWMYSSVFSLPFSRTMHALTGFCRAPVWLQLVVGFVLVDFQYYWFHRSSHRIGFLWAAHAVHHQSEEYNLTTALRQSVLQIFFSAFFYLPLALLGLELRVFVLAVTLNTLYQFWIHTKLVDRLPRWFEWLFNTPSHHRVHHGINNQYLDRNHAGVLMLWDRLFGTFEAEAIEPIYGTVKPVSTWSPVLCNLSGWRELLQKSRAAIGLQKLYAWFAPPEWCADAPPLPPLPPLQEPPLLQARIKYVTAALSLRGQIGLSIEFAITGAAVMWLGVSARDSNPGWYIRGAQMVLASMILLATIRWAQKLVNDEIIDQF